MAPKAFFQRLRNQTLQMIAKFQCPSYALSYFVTYPITLQNHSILDDSVFILEVTVFITEHLALNGLQQIIKSHKCKKVKFGHFFWNNRSTCKVFRKSSHVNMLYDS